MVAIWCKLDTSMQEQEVDADMMQNIVHKKLNSAECAQLFGPPA